MSIEWNTFLKKRRKEKEGSLLAQSFLRVHKVLEKAYPLLTTLKSLKIDIRIYTSIATLNSK